VNGFVLIRLLLKRVVVHNVLANRILLNRVVIGAVVVFLLAGCTGQAEKEDRTLRNPTPADGKPAATTIQTATTGLAPLPDPNHPLQPLEVAKPDDWLDGGGGTTRPLPFAYVDGSQAGAYSILEVMGGGVAVFDFDKDGLLDIFVTGGGNFSQPPVKVTGRSGALFRNKGAGEFEDVTRQSGLEDDGLYCHGCCVGDYNRDGYPDLFIAGYQGCWLYENQKNGTFKNQTEGSKLRCPNWNMSACWADIDCDGWLDLYVVTYAQLRLDPPHICTNEWKLRDVCAPTEFEGEVDLLWRNRGDGTFEDVSHQAGVDVPGRGMGIVAADLDEDGWIDFYVTNDMEENVLLYGGPGMTFTSVAIPAGAAVSPTGEREGSMGVDVGDYNGDGRPDIFYTNFANQDCSLLEMIEGRGFANATSTVGLSGSTSSWVGFGTAFVDFDSDGWEDLFVINGHVLYERPGSRYSQPPRMFRNIEGKRFEDISAHGGPYFRRPHAGRGAAVGDLNNDGAPDLVVVHQQERVAVLFNQHPPQHWIGLHLRSDVSNPDAVGARVKHQFAGRELTRWVHGGGSYLSSRDPRILFPVNAERPVTVTVIWPGGRTEMFTDLIPNRYHELVEGRPASPRQ
jgi:hypothetical protein